MYRHLDSEKTIQTVETLKNRIQERFPGSGLGKVCAELIDIARVAESRADWFYKPHLGVRIGVTIVILLAVVAMLYSITYIKFSIDGFSWGEYIQIMEAGINNLIVIGAAIIFLVSFESRLKRKRALEALYELRAMAHVIDMHQLTKDPHRLTSHQIVTPSSPKVSMTPYELTRYLDYASEMLSLTGKIAAIYGEHIRDEVVLSTVTEIETLTTGLSRKIWQKIMLLQNIPSLCSDSPSNDTRVGGE